MQQHQCTTVWRRPHHTSHVVPGICKGAPSQHNPNSLPPALVLCVCACTPCCLASADSSAYFSFYLSNASSIASGSTDISQLSPVLCFTSFASPVCTWDHVSDPLTQSLSNWQRVNLNSFILQQTHKWFLKPDVSMYSDPGSTKYVLMSQHPNTTCSFSLHPPTDWGSAELGGRHKWLQRWI